MRVEAYTSANCSHVKEACAVLEEALRTAGLPEKDYQIIEVSDFEDAKRKRSFGSPTIRVNGLDIEYADREPEEYTAGCRYYNTAEGWKPAPSSGMVLRAIREALAKES